MKKRNLLFSILFLFLAILFTILVQVVDVEAIGPNGSLVGFATINQLVFDTLKTNDTLYHLTEWVGILPIFIALLYALVGFGELIKAKDLRKVDKFNPDIVLVEGVKQEGLGLAIMNRLIRACSHNYIEV